MQGFSIRSMQSLRDNNQTVICMEQNYLTERSIPM